MQDRSSFSKSPDKGISRRAFVGSVVTAAGVTIVPRHVLGGRGFQAPSDKLGIAGVGIGGMGKGNIERCATTENIVALCDVDEAYAGKVFSLYPNAKRYRDYREMLEKQKDIDAVVVATPDHVHTVVALAAMQLGKHVYVQKPLTRTVAEARRLTEAAKKYKVATQMGNQGHSNEGLRNVCEWIWDGAIGPVREVHSWTNRPVWPQGVLHSPRRHPARSQRPLIGICGSARCRCVLTTRLTLPFNWRAWQDFGAGALGDMGLPRHGRPVQRPETRLSDKRCGVYGRHRRRDVEETAKHRRPIRRHPLSTIPSRLAATCRRSNSTGTTAG